VRAAETATASGQKRTPTNALLREGETPSVATGRQCRLIKVENSPRTYPRLSTLLRGRKWCASRSKGAAGVRVRTTGAAWSALTCTLMRACRRSTIA